MSVCLKYWCVSTGLSILFSNTSHLSLGLSISFSSRCLNVCRKNAMSMPMDISLLAIINLIRSVLE